MFNFTVEQMKKQNAVHTTGEIHQQPAVGKELVGDFFSQQASYKELLDAIYKKHKSVRVIFTEAGTSALSICRGFICLTKSIYTKIRS